MGTKFYLLYVLINLFYHIYLITVLASFYCTL